MNHTTITQARSWRPGVRSPAPIAALGKRKLSEHGVAILEEFAPYQNPYHVSPWHRLGDVAGLMAAESIIVGERRTFDLRVDPQQNYTALTAAA